MSDYEPKRGERVLVESEVDDRACVLGSVTVSRGDYAFPPIPRNEVHPHPGVSVAALLEECEEADTVIRSLITSGARTHGVADNYYELRAAREIANAPKPELGQRIEANGKLDGIAELEDGYLLLQMRVTPGNFKIKGVHPDDIRTEQT